jgi:hypothetical protein
MTERHPLFDDLVDGDLAPTERERLQSVHELLLRAGPPPELPPALEVPPAVETAQVIPFPRRYRFTAIAAAAAIAVVLFGAGYLLGGNGGSSSVLRTVEMRGSGGAVASLAVFAKDDAGNWPMELTVSGLEPLPAGETYELWLTRSGKLADPCGTFAVARGTTEVPLNAPYRLRDYDGWVVVRAGTTTPVLST